MHRGAQATARTVLVRHRAGGVRLRFERCIAGRVVGARRRVAGHGGGRFSWRRVQGRFRARRVALHGEVTRSQTKIRHGRGLSVGFSVVHRARGGHVRLRVPVAHGAIRHGARARGRSSTEELRSRTRPPAYRRNVRLFDVQNVHARANARHRDEGASRGAVAHDSQLALSNASLRRDAPRHRRATFRRFRSRFHREAVSRRHRPTVGASSVGVRRNYPSRRVTPCSAHLCPSSERRLCSRTRRLASSSRHAWAPRNRNQRPS